MVSRYAIGIITVLAGCNSSQIAPVAPDVVARQNTAPYSYRVLHRFSVGEHGGSGRPLSGLTNVGGTLYGNTYGNERGDGTVFSLSTAGKYEKVFRFSGADGSAPWDDPLLDVDGTLYGTTYYGGDSADGVVFSLTTSGVENVIYKFAGGSDGEHPWSGLVDVNGTLYGTTSNGGGGGSCYNGCGTVYTIGTSGAEHVIHAFSGGSDGATPGAALLDVNGTLFGTTQGGGGPHGDGCVYSISPSGAEKVLYSFSGADGAAPLAPLIDVHGTLYGTTESGGQYNDGTVFSISTAGKEKVLYNFAGHTDGKNPESGLLEVHGTLYGLTNGGGSSSSACDDSYGEGCGTIYSVTTKGAEKVLYAFKGGSDGWAPQDALINVNGTLYGTTRLGGEGGGSSCYDAGCGTVFEITP